MSLALDFKSALPDTSALERAILETLAYSDVFDFPLRLDELHYYLPQPCSMDELRRGTSLSEYVESEDGYYFLAGRKEIVDLRKRREDISRKAYQRAISYGRILEGLPFIRMVALTGSLAVRNCDETGDYDYLLIARDGRVWLARAFALLLNRFARIFGETLCPNLIISESALEWKERDLYSAREIAQMVLIGGSEVYSRLREVNRWVEEFLPNAALCAKSRLHQGRAIFQRIFEFFLRGKLGDKIEKWEMERKIARFSKQTGFGIETKFNAEICQGNFDHHGLWTMQKFNERLVQLKIRK